MLLQQQPRRKLIISLTPLIDVVFILLVFFMLASNFVQTTEYQVTTHTAAHLQNDQMQTMLIHVDQAGEYQLDGQAVLLNDLRVELLKQQAQAAEKKLLVNVMVVMAASATLQQALDAYDIANSANLSVQLSPQVAAE